VSRWTPCKRADFFRRLAKLAWSALAVPIVLVSAAFGQQPPDPAESIMRAREILAERARHLPDYTCSQSTDRRYFTPRKKGNALSCDQIRTLGSQDLVLERTDRLRLDIKVSRGVEIGSWRGSEFTAKDIFDLVGAGPYGTGTLGAIIWNVFVSEGASYKYLGEETAAGRRVLSYGYEVPVSASHYNLKSGAHWVATAFFGNFLLDAESFELARLTEQATELPPDSGACEADTEVDYQKVQVGGGEFLLPKKSVMRQVMQDESEVQSTAVYSGCRAYSTESTIHFEDLPAAEQTKTAEPPQAVPAGLPFTIVLAEPIDADSAAAGDIVKCKLAKALREPHAKAMLAPVGAIVEARIVQMEHWLIPAQLFRISLMLEKLETDGAVRPLYASPFRHSTIHVASGPVNVVLPPVGQSPHAAAFIFPADKSGYVVRPGHASEWVTVAPPR